MHSAAQHELPAKIARHLRIIVARTDVRSGGLPRCGYHSNGSDGDRAPDRTKVSLLHRRGRARCPLALPARAKSWLCHPHARTVTSVDHS